MRQPIPRVPRRERGAILVVTLMFLVLLTIVGLSSISSTTLEEKMAGNQREQITAFQAAESALRDAEIDLETGIGGTGNRDPMTVTANFSTATALCSAAFTNGTCQQPSYQAQIVTAAGWDWESTTKTVRYGTYTGATQYTGLYSQPRYVIEYLVEKDGTAGDPAGTRYFRITARGWGANQYTTVTLQSIYKIVIGN